jgi:hypothetical protein
MMRIVFVAGSSLQWFGMQFQADMTLSFDGITMTGA